MRKCWGGMGDGSGEPPGKGRQACWHKTVTEAASALTIE